MPTCPICGTEIKEGEGFCSRCWRRLVAGEASRGPSQGKSRKKLAAIILPCVAAIIVTVLVLTRLLPGPSGHVAEVESIGISAHDLGAKLFAPQLTPLQQQNLWKDYQGKQVQWTNELESVPTETGGLTAYFLNPLDSGRTAVAAIFDPAQQASLLQLSNGDLVTYTGVLASLGQNEIRLTDCVVVTRALVPLWWDNEDDVIDTADKRVLVGGEVVCLGPSTYDDAQGTNHVLPKITAIDRETGEFLWQHEETKSILVGIDSNYVYAWHPVKIVRMSDSDSYWYWYASSIIALDGATGQVGWDLSLSGDTHCESQISCLPDQWSLSDYVGCCILPGRVKDEITTGGGPGLTFLMNKAPLYKLTYEYEGVIYKSACAVYGGLGTECGALQAVDQKTDEVIWTMTFGQTGMTDFSIVDGILYVSTDKGAGAFQL